MKRKVLNTTVGRMIPHIVTVVVVALMLLSYRTWAMPAAGPAAPHTGPGVISYQGNLIDVTGEPVDDTVDMTFRLYNVAVGGTALWTEAHTDGNAVPVNNGLFNVLLGSLTPIPSTVWNNPALYLGVTVGGDSEMTPREPVGMVPYALHAVHADRAYGLSAADGAPADAVVVDDAGHVTVSGADNDGNVAALEIQSGSQSMLLDGNEIDSNVTLYLNHNSSSTVNIASGGGVASFGGNVEVSGEENSGEVAALRIRSGSQSMLLDGNEIDSNATLYLNYNSREDVSIAHGGGDVRIWGDITVDGNITNFTVSDYSIRSNDTTQMKRLENSICFLTRVGHNTYQAEIPSNSHLGCTISRVEDYWQLKANDGAPSGFDYSEVWCGASCLSW